MLCRMGDFVNPGPGYKAEDWNSVKQLLKMMCESRWKMLFGKIPDDQREELAEVFDIVEDANPSMRQSSTQ